MKTSVLGSLLLLLTLPAFGQTPPPPATPVPTNLVATGIPGVVAAGTPIQLIKANTDGAEGPVLMPDGSAVLFVEREASRISKIDLKTDQVTTFLEPSPATPKGSNKSNGLAFDTKGRLISVQRPGVGNNIVGVLWPLDKVTTLADNDGKGYRRLNDLTIDSKDGVYFSEQEGPDVGLYYVPAGGKARKVFSLTRNPNGVQLSPDGKTLYLNAENGEYVLAFDVQPDGSVTNGRNFGEYASKVDPDHKDGRVREGNGADGMVVDAAGNVYTATNAGVEVFSPKGERLGVIPLRWGADVRLQKPSNMVFAGGPDKEWLYVTAGSSEFKIHMLSRGIKGRSK